MLNIAVRPSMSPIGSLLRIALVSYFAFVFFRAVKKLKSRDVGTMFSIKDEETVQVSDNYRVLLVRVGTLFSATY